MKDWDKRINHQDWVLLLSWRGNAVFVKALPLVKPIACAYLDGNEICGLLVDSTYRRRGIGRLIIDLMEQSAGIPLVVSIHDSNWKAREFIKKCGFIEIDLKPTEYGGFIVYGRREAGNEGAHRQDDHQDIHLR